MDLSFDNRALLGRSYRLDGGLRVRLRLVQVRDAPAIAQLFERHGLEPEELELARLVRFDPRHRLVICASVLIDVTETIVGIGATQLDPPEPDLLFVDDSASEDLRELLIRALVGRAREIAARRAA